MVSSAALLVLERRGDGDQVKAFSRALEISPQNRSKEVCLICSSVENELWVQDYEALRLVDAVYSIRRCKKCDFKFVWPHPSADEMAKLYKRGFYFCPERAGFSFRIISFLSYLFSSARAAIVGKYLKTAGKILDVGCGAGDFLCYMKQNGWKVFGVDNSEEAGHVAGSKLAGEIFCGEFSEFPAVANSFDAVTFWHSLEHVAEPEAFLKKAHGLLKEKGILVISVPNGQGICNLFKRRWAFLDLPRHLFLFSPKHLETLLARNGFSIVREIFFMMEYSPLILLLDFLNLFTTRKMYLYYLIKRGGLRHLRLSMFGHLYNFLISVLVGILAVIPIVILSLIFAFFKAGDVFTIVARKD